MGMLEFVLCSMRGKEETWSYTLERNSVQKHQKPKQQQQQQYQKRKGKKTLKIAREQSEMWMVSMWFSLCFCVNSLVHFQCVGNKTSKNLCAIVFNLQFISLLSICMSAVRVCVVVLFQFLEPAFFWFILRKCQCLSQSLSISHHVMKMGNQKSRKTQRI